MGFKETKMRSFVKSGTFRIIVIIADLIVIYALTKEVTTTLALTVFTNFSSTFLYFLHERFWNQVTWGRRKTG
jgi:uncharacterized membrane protein